MNELQVAIVPYDPRYQAQIDAFMEDIANEFADPLCSNTNIRTASLLPKEKYWVATADDQAIGTIGFAAFQNDAIALKRFFLNQKFRGRGIADLLLDAVITWCKENGIGMIYLGTMTQFQAAQKFYEIRGFEKVPLTGLPPDFPPNPVDSVFYKRSVN